jgi:hypothetical protein
MLFAKASPRVAWADVRPMSGRKTKPAFSSLYRYRNLVERFFNKLKHFRAVATRYDKDHANFLASVKLASARIWLRPMCLIPGFDGALFTSEWKDALWVRFFTGAPPRRRRSVARYSIVKRA